MAGWDLHPLEKRRLTTAHTRNGHLLNALFSRHVWNAGGFGSRFHILSSIQPSAYDVQAPPFREKDQVFNPYVGQFINSRTEGTIQMAVTAV